MNFDEARRSAPLSVIRPALTALSVAVLLAAAPARAEEDTNPFNSLLGFFGMQVDKEDETIDYRARAPLVVPPRRDLPQPKEAARDPAWPKDPDVEAQRKAALDSRRPAPHNFLNTRPELSPQELEAGRGGKANTEPADECGQATNGNPNCLYTPWKILQSAFGGGSPDKVEPGVEPPRKYLTEPPPGYRAATNAVKAVPEAPKEHVDAADPGAYIRSQRPKSSVDN